MGILGEVFLKRFFIGSLFFLLTFSANSARAEVPYLWGGWNFYPYYWNGAGTVQGSFLQGMGAYLTGKGEYNLMTAEAAAINTQTWIQWNEYVNAVTANMAKHYAERQRNEKLHHLKLRRIQYLNLRDFPTQRDIQNGDAINLKIALLTGGGYAANVYDLAKVPTPARILMVLPFRRASDGINVSLNELTGKIYWPRSLVTNTSTKNRFDVQKALQDAANQIPSGFVSTESIDVLDRAIDDLDNGLVQNGKKGIEERTAIGKLKSYVRALSSKDFTEGLSDLINLKEPTLGEILRSMNNHHLMLGRATSPNQIDLFNRLYRAIQSVPMLLDAATLEALADYMAIYRY